MLSSYYGRFYEIFMFRLYEQKTSQRGRIPLKCDVFYSCNNTKTGQFSDTIRRHKPIFDFLETCFEHVLPEKKMAETIKLQSTGEKLEFTWKNEMVDDLISSLEHFNALM